MLKLNSLPNGSAFETREGQSSNLGERMWRRRERGRRRRGKESRRKRRKKKKGRTGGGGGRRRKELSARFPQYRIAWHKLS